MTVPIQLNVAAFLPAVAAVHGDRPAVSVDRTLFCDYAGLSRRVAALAGAFVGSLGLEPGERVALAMRNSPQYFEILLACWHAGLVAVPMNAKLHPREMAYILGHTASRLCFVSEDLREGVAQLQAELPALARVVCVDEPAYEILVEGPPLPMAATLENDPAWLFYTSGTTGRPKGATLSHRNLLAMALRYYADIAAVDETHCYFHAAPLSHGGGLYGLPHLMKGSHQVIPASRGFDVDEIFDLLEVYDKATFFAAPTMLTRMTNHPRAATARVSAIDTIYYGGAPMYVEDLKRAIERFGPRLYQIFGQGESPMTGVGLAKALHVDYGNPKYERRLASTGIARTGVSVRVVDEHDVDVPVGELGEVLFRSEVTMLGYWKDPEATARALRGGWLHTGDVGFADEDGFITLKDRSKDMIISGGSNIYPREIEEVLMMDPRVLECSVVGRPHHDWGEEVVAFVVAHAGQRVQADELDALCLANIARFKRPKAYFFVEGLPKSNYGKVLKTALREQLAAGLHDALRPGEAP
ncbi:long-chain fatty acid--CoA ligase [Variovorax defluvii]|uniref:Long-chain fatty acid--CoA ligase n=1 Tax=Variovorax defluvii TaxID=913761 RepID=A0ABP8HF96_9BURK